MSKFLIASRHTEEDCVRAIDATLDKGSNILDKFVFGCSEGDHTGYAIVDAKSISDALGLVPDFLQKDACITKVSKLSPADVKSMHSKAA